MLIDTAKNLKDNLFEVIKAWQLFDRRKFEEVYKATEKASQVIILIQHKIYQIEKTKKDLIEAQGSVQLRVK